MKWPLNKRLLFVGGGALTLTLIAGVLFMRAPAPVLETETVGIPTVQINSPNEGTPASSSATATNELIKTEETATSNTALKSFENKNELAEFKTLKQKVFLTDNEKDQKKNFLRDRHLLESVKNLFKYQAPYQDLEDQQDIAVDLLLEAIKSGGDADTARAVFKELIADSTIEDGKLSPAQRQNLAGVKAEVLYQWSALEPDRAQEIQNTLPGPVSIKIWKNVKAQQQNNEAESALTK